MNISLKHNMNGQNMKHHLSRGFTLIEVMISIIILLIGIVGILSVMLMGTKVFSHAENVIISEVVARNASAMMTGRKMSYEELDYHSKGTRYSNSQVSHTTDRINVIRLGRQTHSMDTWNQVFPIPNGADDKDHGDVGNGSQRRNIWTRNMTGAVDQSKNPNDASELRRTRWVLQDRGFPSLENDPLKRSHYWLPMLRDANSLPGQFEWQAFVFVMRRNEKLYRETYMDGWAAGAQYWYAGATMKDPLQIPFPMGLNTGMKYVDADIQNAKNGLIKRRYNLVDYDPSEPSNAKPGENVDAPYNPILVWRKADNGNDEKQENMTYQIPGFAGSQGGGDANFLEDISNDDDYYYGYVGGDLLENDAIIPNERNIRFGKWGGNTFTHNKGTAMLAGDLISHVRAESGRPFHDVPRASVGFQLQNAFAGSATLWFWVVDDANAMRCVRIIPVTGDLMRR